MMSVSRRRFSMKIYTYCQVCILLVSAQQILSDNASVSREGLREEHLLPVRMTREAADSGFEGSGDDDAMPIRVLQSGVMERMTLKTDDALEDDNKILESMEKLEDMKSKESIEATVEGSGFGDADSEPVAITATEKDAGNMTISDDSNSDESSEVGFSTVTEETITTVFPKVDVKEISLDTSTAKEEESSTLLETTIVTESTTERKETTTLVPEIFTTTETEEATETVVPDISMIIKAEETQTATLPETTTLSTTLKEEITTPMLIVGKEKDIETEKEPEPITEIIQVKKVQPAFAEIPARTEAPETLKPEVATTAIPAVTIFDNGTLLENENLTAGTGTLLMKSDSRFLDTNEKVLESSKDPSRLGTYIVISLILLSFLSLIGFILMRRRVQKRRKKSNMDPETLDTEKALLSLSEYKDHPDGVDEGKIKNNEITPIVIKSNSQINKFEKNTNFSSPKNLNTKANEKNVEKDNVLRKTSDNLTQVIIEDATKDVEEEKAQSNAEKLIVRTHLDQDSIPKKPVIVNRTSLGCMPVSHD